MKMKVKRKQAVMLGLIAVFAVLLAITMLTGKPSADGEYTSVVYATALSLLPPVIAIGLALFTKEVYTSLLAGILAGALLYANGNLELMLNTMLFNEDGGMVSKLSDSGNVGILVFLVMLGILVSLLNKAGGSAAFGKWASKHIKTRIGAQISVMILGVLIFVDDYFNCLTVGSVMRPVTDRHKVSRAKLSYIIDATAAPVCIIAPVSSWAVAVGGYMGEDGFNTFVASIPYNFYALLTIFFVFFMLFLQKDFGPMAAAQADAEGRIPAEGSALEAVSLARIADKAQVDLEGAPNIPTVVTEEGDIDDAAAGAIEEYKGLNISDRGTIWDLIVPILVLIVFSILGMMYMGGFFSGVDFATAVGENPVMGLCIGAVVALCVAAAMFLPRKLMNLGGFVEAMSEGVRSMIGAIMILVLAWSLGGCCRYLLGTGEFVSGFLNGLGVGLDLLPAIIFLVAAFIGFAMGTSWGTIALILPIIIGVFDAADPLFLVAVGSALAGAVYGDHISPISDTTILSSAGAKCNHLRHVATQIPYATLVMIVCFVGYVIAGFTKSPWISLALGVVLIVIAVLVLVRMEASKKAKA